jgi:hypothetical protein
VLTSLAVACVPAAVDECTISVVEEAVCYEIRRPDGENGRRPAGRGRPLQELSMPLQQERCAAKPAFSATVTLRWIRRRPQPAYLTTARLLVERAADMLHRERLAAALTAAVERADNLELALKSNREIGQAVGILMATRKVTAEQAFDLLRRISQHTNRKVQDIAAEVCTTGIRDLPGARPP